MTMLLLLLAIKNAVRSGARTWLVVLLWLSSRPVKVIS
jgi:hypothetical protein